MNLSGFSTGDFQIIKPEPQILVLRHSIARGVLWLGGTIGFLAVCLYLFLDKPGSLASAVEVGTGKLQNGISSWIVLFSLIAIVGASSLQLTRVFMKANRVEFNGMSRSIKYGGEDISFDNVANLQLRKILGGEMPDEHLISLVLHDERKLGLVSHLDRDRILSAAADIADLVRTEIKTVGA